MTKWEEKCRSYAWHNDPRAKTLKCVEEGSIPKCAVTGYPSSQRSLRDAVAVMIKCIGDDVTKDIYRVLKSAGADLLEVSQTSQTQTDLRRMVLSLQPQKYRYVQEEFLKICEEYSAKAI